MLQELTWSVHLPTGDGSYGAVQVACASRLTQQRLPAADERSYPTEGNPDHRMVSVHLASGETGGVWSATSGGLPGWLLPHSTFWRERESLSCRLFRPGTSETETRVPFEKHRLFQIWKRWVDMLNARKNVEEYFHLNWKGVSDTLQCGRYALWVK